MARLTKKECLDRAADIVATEGINEHRGYVQFIRPGDTIAESERIRRIVEYGRAEGLREAAGEV